MLFPKFECTGIEEGTEDFRKYCIPHYFCNNDEHQALGNRVVDWKIVDNSNITLNNIMTKHNLICASKLMISSFSMSYYAGYASGSLILPALCDKRGRKKFLAGAILVHAISSFSAMALP